MSTFHVASFGNADVLFSYGKIVAMRHDGSVYLTDDWDYSATTKRHVTKFLNSTTKEIHDKLHMRKYEIINPKDIQVQIKGSLL